MDDKLDLTELLSVAYKLNNWVNFYWNFYIGFGGAIVGWVFSSKGGWRRAQQVVVTLMFIGFACVSFSAISSTYSTLQATVEALRATPFAAEDHSQTALATSLIQRLSGNGSSYMLTLHVLGDLLVITTIWAFAAANRDKTNVA